ncbi:hypothetical protein SAMD00023353_2801270 [Rosellinia necatrix]|uniref:Uncharacterized protein n=1 Tax=Rosellinia necatrix TaxID=77044 RepID=A0A1S8A9G0_ROSNE|nr:hypothetical protein SAMD00023353_2801270 [Rosellinia necatrix]
MRSNDAWWALSLTSCSRTLASRISTKNPNTTPSAQDVHQKISPVLCSMAASLPLQAPRRLLLSRARPTLLCPRTSYLPLAIPSLNVCLALSWRRLVSPSMLGRTGVL